jgi:hypothetical protein
MVQQIPHLIVRKQKRKKKDPGHPICFKETTPCSHFLFSILWGKTRRWPSSGRIMDLGKPREKVLETPSQPGAEGDGTNLSSPAMQGNTNRIVVQAHLGRKRNLISKISNTKRAGDMAQMV